MFFPRLRTLRRPDQHPIALRASPPESRLIVRGSLRPESASDPLLRCHAGVELPCRRIRNCRCDVPALFGLCAQYDAVVRPREVDQGPPFVPRLVLGRRAGRVVYVSAGVVRER